MNQLPKFINNWPIRIQLIIGMAIVHSTIMLFFVFDLTAKQKSFLIEKNQEQAQALAKSIAAASVSGTLTQDSADLTEIIKASGEFPNVQYVFITNNEGKVLAHTQSNFAGTYVNDEISKKMYQTTSSQILVNNDYLLDVATPIITQEKIIGWVRVSLNRTELNNDLHNAQIKGIIYTILAIIIGGILAWYIGNFLTSQLQKLTLIASQIKNGKKNLRFENPSNNELGIFASVFNNMLDVLSERELNLTKSKEQLLASEERLELALRGSHDGIWDCDIQTLRFYFSPRFKEILGFDDSELTGTLEEIKSRVHPGDHINCKSHIFDHLEGKTPQLNFQYRMKHKNGNYLWIHTKGIVLRKETGEAYRLVGTISDISEKIYAEEEKEKLYLQLRQTQKMEAVGQLTGGIAHDFNNILASIIGFTNMALSKSKDDNKISDYLNKIMKSSERAKSLVQQLLAFSRGGDPTPQLVILSDTVEDTLRLLTPILPSSIQLNFLPLNFDSKIKIDPVQLQQIITNLCLNARDAIGESQGVIEIIVEQCQLKNKFCTSCGRDISSEWVKVKVRDNGPGIPENILPKIFEPFFSTKELGKGSGMGLAMVHGIMHRQNGHILVTSSSEGTEFSLIFPIAKEEFKPAQVADKIHVITKTNSNKKILAVDDEQDLRELYLDMLSDIGYHVTTASDAKEALQIISSNPDDFDLVITDQTMPNMTGIELVEKVKTLNPQLPIILCTGNTEGKKEILESHSNLSALLIKPFDIGHLMQLIQNTLEEKA